MKKLDSPLIAHQTAYPSQLLSIDTCYIKQVNFSNGPNFFVYIDREMAEEKNAFWSTVAIFTVKRRNITPVNPVDLLPSVYIKLQPETTAERRKRKNLIFRLFKRLFP
jgi:hypothetical protein